ncbi:MAG: putative metal-binding motif-containing protein [Sandaracinus sp.]|nr:putative metal-binding motif-containing protein [Sandaracinus sp.]
MLRVGDCDDSNRSIHPGARDADCNGRDGDCDGRADEDADLVEFFPDEDGDGFGDTLGRRTACTVPSRGFVTVGGDCDDDDDDVRPDATELCNGLDDDCDGEVDDGFETVSCGRGACLRTVGLCEDGMSGRCTPGFPSAEICNGLDDGCNAWWTTPGRRRRLRRSFRRRLRLCGATGYRVVRCLPATATHNDFPLDGCEADLATA